MIDEKPAMQHLALIMDGNRRWAREQGSPSWWGHRAGVDSLERAIKFCVSADIKYLSVYAFSIENFQRSRSELHHLFDIIAKELASERIKQFVQQQVKLCFVGDRSLFPAQLVSLIEDAEKKTADGDRLQVNMLFCYGGQQEIVHGVKRAIEKIKQGLLTPEQLSEKTFADCLWNAGTPPPDLIIRTGGAKRLSNFLLYSAAYSELCFLDCYWPEITEVHLQQAVNNFLSRKRNFGV